MAGSNPAWCYLCGLPIPGEIVSHRHPLFGTVDHVIPLSRNGTDALYNRAPAHRLCNERKGNGMVHPEEFALELRGRVLALLESLGCKVTERVRRAAIRRVLQGWPTWIPTCRREAGRVAIQRWEDEGGSLWGTSLGDVGLGWENEDDVFERSRD